MAKRKKQEVSAYFNTIRKENEDEILEAYALITQEDEDLLLNKLSEYFHMLNIPSCFIEDILGCIEYFYDIRSVLDSTKRNKDTAVIFQMLYTFTITESSDESDPIDIIDIDKLIQYTDKLIKFRDNFIDIVDSWKLFVDASCDKKLSRDQLLSYQLTLPDLKRIKNLLKLDASSLSDSLLIDMLSCATDENDNNISFDLKKLSQGLFISIKDFALIIGNLGEFDL